MFDLTILDYIYIVIIVASTVWATIRGGVYETIATLSWVIAGVAACFVSPVLNGWLQSWFNLSESTVGTLVASYFIVFFVILIVVSFFNQKLRNWIQDSVMNVTDHTLGVIFGIVRGIAVMGVVYWCALWYYSDTSEPHWVQDARTAPLMQVTAEKIDEWFIPGEPSKLLARARKGMEEINPKAIYDNLVNPAVSDKATDKKGDDKKSGSNKKDVKSETSEKQIVETGYKSSERAALENQLLQIETAAKAEEARAKVEAEEKKSE